MAKKSLPPIVWTPKLLLVKDIKPTEKNYKIKTALGQERLRTSLKKFGIAGTVIVNQDKMLIDGNSRLEEEKQKGSKKIWVSWPSRKLSAKEFQEMSAMYDVAVAGDIDFDRIDSDLGTSKQFFDDWKREVPKELLDKLGKATVLDSDPTETKTPGKGAPVSNVKMIQLFFSEREELLFRKLEEKARLKFKKDNTTDTVMEVFKKMFA